MSWLTTWFLAVPAAAFVACWILYMIVMSLKHRYNSTSCSKCRLMIKAIALPIGTVAWLLDVALNYTLFMVMGPAEHLTISSRLKHYRREGISGWRRKVADFICEKMLNPHDPGHC